MKFCRQCGTGLLEDEMFCPRCGYDGEMFYSESAPERTRTGKNRNMIALFLALLPGLVNIFGLGQLYLRCYVRAAIFIALTVILYIVNIYYLTSDWEVYFTGLVLGVYLIQSMDVFMLTSRRNSRQ